MTVTDALLPRTSDPLKVRLTQVLKFGYHISFLPP